jgi:hypothetical protein
MRYMVFGRVSFEFVLGTFKANEHVVAFDGELKPETSVLKNHVVLASMIVIMLLTKNTNGLVKVISSAEKHEFHPADLPGMVLARMAVQDVLRRVPRAAPRDVCRGRCTARRRLGPYGESVRTDHF